VTFTCCHENSDKHKHVCTSCNGHGIPLTSVVFIKISKLWPHRFFFLFGHFMKLVKTSAGFSGFINRANLTGNKTMHITNTNNKSVITQLVLFEETLVKYQKICSSKTSSIHFYISVGIEMNIDCWILQNESMLFQHHTLHTNLYKM